MGIRRRNMSQRESFAVVIFLLYIIITCSKGVRIFIACEVDTGSQWVVGISR